MTVPGLRWRLLAAPLAQHKGGTVLSVVAIALGVALGYAVQLINQVAFNEFSQAAQVLSGQADLEIRGPRYGFDEALYPRVAMLPEIAVASPVLEIDARLAGRRESLKIVGLDVFRAAQVQHDLVAAGAADSLDFLRPDRIFLSQAAADHLGLGPGDEFLVQVGLGSAGFRVAGILRGDSVRQPLGVVDISALQWRMERLGSINGIDLRLLPGVDVDAFAKRLQASLPAGLSVVRPEANVESSASLTRAYRVNLNVLALVALFTGGLLVFSTQALSVVRRRAQLALLRVVGMTRLQLVRLLLGEGLLVGICGAALGIAMGHVGAELVVRELGPDLGAGVFRGFQPQVPIDIAGLLLFAVLGTATAVVGSLAPALEAANARPAQSLSAGDEQRAFARLQPAWPGMAVFAAGAALTQAGPVRGLPLFGYLAIALILLGTIMLMPRLAKICFGLLPAWGAVPARLARAQLAGAPGQAMVSLSAIVASVSLMVSMAIMVTSFRLSLEEWLDRMLPADLYLRTGLQNEAAYFSGAIQERIRAIAGVRRVDFLRSQQILLSAGRPRVVLFARPVDRADPKRLLPLIGPFLVPNDPPPLWASEAMVDLYGYRLGETVELPIEGGTARFTVAGIWRDYARQQGSVVIERDVYARFSGDRLANDAALWLERGTDVAAVRESIRAAIPGSINLEIAVPRQIREFTLRIFDRTFAVTYGLEAVAVVIGLFGLSSSFGALVLARRREFGMLRHIGVTRRQIGEMLVSEGLLVSALGLATGLALGWLIGVVLIHVVNRQSFHWSMELHLPWIALALFSLVMMALSTVTVLASGRRAMGQDVVQAVKDDW